MAGFCGGGPDVRWLECADAEMGRPREYRRVPFPTMTAAREPLAASLSRGGRLARGLGVAIVVALAGAVAFAASHWPLWAVAGVLVVVAVTTAAAKLWVAVAVLVASFYFDSYLAVGAGVVTVGKLLGAVALAAWFLRWSVGRRPIVADPLFWPLAGLAAWIPLSASNAYDPAAALTVALRYLTFFALVFLVVQTVDGDRRTATRLIDVAVAAAAASAVVGLYNFFLVAGEGRAQGPLEDPNDYAFMLAVTVPLALYRIGSAAGPLRRGLAALALLVMFAAILASFSRSALVGLAVAGAWAAATRRVPLRWTALAVAGLTAVALASYLLQPQRVETALLEKRRVAQSNVDQRLVAWRVALEEFRSSQVLGVGPGNFETRFEEFALSPSPETGAIAAHNAYLSVLAELGVPGIGLFLAYLVIAWSRLRRRLPGDPDADALQSTLAAGFVVAMVGALFLTEQFYAPLWLLPALGATLVRAPPNGRAVAGRAA
jgi:putative inorganic carbon (hco3(-)) transporter